MGQNQIKNPRTMFSYTLFCMGGGGGGGGGLQIYFGLKDVPRQSALVRHIFYSNTVSQQYPQSYVQSRVPRYQPIEDVSWMDSEEKKSAGCFILKS